MFREHDGRLTGCNRLLEELNGLLLAREAAALLMMQPSQLLQDLGMIRISVQHTLIGTLSTIEILLLLVHMTDLEPDIFLGQWRGRRVDDVLKTLCVCQYAVILRKYTWRKLYLPQDSGRIFVVACILYPSESRFRWPFQNRAASA